ncbi:hypothetical protein GLOIN_2v1710031 [Rhizophagus irregularis DAOM 181602=DAOM 197198]|uniref:Uncharacterized protein n=1 Tax=Rhizophagus irregularis (strain DAOM 181602 / DAOM 197198 / MUCL 43194) TaxID=747089 RepID=A0A2P4P5W1_RHIID|nr:hypothetical protein GLOIN_2v1710031 [Rhizophagus irregularis DAOM 181602=DAOM 197198]POG60781.1 hypothetical protein GLOIN_2v1710031 [Rhizophagus irregularis DAOM 181602=DAOM 197198]|eukprot:XP_025167647.1 hypothetical protein GLOIN_2v1710031 [Rhizophagus irregularis DAOM 181602=DAOM 197198]
MYSAIPSIQVAEYTFANPPSPICFISSNLSNGTHSRNDGPYLPSPIYFKCAL